ncbi:hypothetical protein GTR04_2452 [Trichophyton interdigitale]|uniref:Uncharacterized protein n=1 Tax=Trichophyton interdigitale TaxID=101480 RepID=A0A9P5CY85_9EURO|nr:hypothetical protein GY632_2084 [Trichophyton interdigitale]KAG8210177.1 hypothetical protein GTR04_2452 [Trichophyton interdigitale]
MGSRLESVRVEMRLIAQSGNFMVPSRELAGQDAKHANQADPAQIGVIGEMEDEDPFKHLPEHEKLILKRQLDLSATNALHGFVSLRDTK